ncbi:unnamed protein product [Lactuca virosa]|uniref:Protein TSSC4 n=1 Tax=Lactuca virosa TaxID=75947 RepID=A0AAU9MH59_9ASTR|nr:unnamed protein product [Lactuca virosa]
MQAFNNDVDTTTHESGEKQHYLQRKKKRDLALESWKWNEVIDLVSSDNQHQLTDEDDTTDTAESVKPFKIPRLTIQTRNRFFKLRHLPDDEDYGNWLESPVDMNQPIQEYDAPRQAEDDVGVIQQNPVGNDVHIPTGAVVAWPDEE